MTTTISRVILMMAGTLVLALVVPGVEHAERPLRDASQGITNRLQDSQEEDGPSVEDPKLALIERLLKQIDDLQKELTTLREQLAQANLERDKAVRELEEMRQFISDHREFGDDFQRYKEIRELNEQAARRQAMEEARKRREEARKQRLAERQRASGQTPVEQAEREKIERFRQAGFAPVGLDVYMGRTGFFYHQITQTGSRVEYEPGIGDFLEPVQRTSIDFSRMTISGTVLNAADEVRNIGVAIAFFDRAGNQVGSEIVQVRNARPNVPYPFTSTITMGLNEPFVSSTRWVLFADLVTQSGGN